MFVYLLVYFRSSQRHVQRKAERVKLYRRKQLLTGPRYPAMTVNWLLPHSLAVPPLYLAFLEWVSIPSKVAIFSYHMSKF